jgi:N-acetylglutamate synthase-like GNAT family acetyltransferase
MEKDSYLNTILINFPQIFSTLNDARKMVKLRNKRFNEKHYLDLHSFAAYDDGHTPIATANIVYDDRQPTLAELSGASVLPEYQHQGIYSDLLYIRAAHAKSRGITHLFITADNTTSAPIVSKKGFQTVESFKDLIYEI